MERGRIWESNRPGFDPRYAVYQLVSPGQTVQLYCAAGPPCRQSPVPQVPRAAGFPCFSFSPLKWAEGWRTYCQQSCRLLLGTCWMCGGSLLGLWALPWAWALQGWGEESARPRGRVSPSPSPSGGGIPCPVGPESISRACPALSPIYSSERESCPVGLRGGQGVVDVSWTECGRLAWGIYTCACESLTKQNRGK